jgi:hypothetical protein
MHRTVPTRQISLAVKDEAGRPIPQARLLAKTRSFNTPKEGLSATEQGMISFESPSFTYGGGGIVLLGFIPLGSAPSAPKERYEVIADGYWPLKFNETNFFAGPHQSTLNTLTNRSVKNQGKEMLIYERTVLLKKKQSNR